MKTIVCFSGDKSKQIACWLPSASYSCGEPCTFKYDCNVHSCTKKCHQEKHTWLKCPLDPSLNSKCCCGSKTLIELGTFRSLCTDPLVSCGQTCNKSLPCGHKCIYICHEGACSPCLESEKRSCQCGKSLVDANCADIQVSGKCKSKCSKKMSCNRHTCQELCCPYEFHECEKLCGKTLSCTKHTCLQACGHAGRCHECVEGVSFDESVCNCGRTIQHPPIPCNAPSVLCKQPCRRQRPCRHPNLTVHNCHLDDVPCPPCMIFTTKSWYFPLTKVRVQV
jgi:transcriptional repressor NF-X1